MTINNEKTKVMPIGKYERNIQIKLEGRTLEQVVA